MVGIWGGHMWRGGGCGSGVTKGLRVSRGGFNKSLVLVIWYYIDTELNRL